ncbi:MAG: YebC/PmpR family DNA-binding transcriptional regulator [Bacillota bacterium]|nr:YebC/PmpR family DNA-binding transcriptional regulator [Bacillota bacterium]MDI9414471.1 YebC/PmpR family DNA-binding transcriptional regulator [Bacillota bacterium]HOB89107.1 YebC/PmpR family DNA-binding transcriptional regulator [Bacillota bacterium]HPU61814.1 YebC/PmpR family DNA-binding transcriptional regulator [Bacillota bacterium]HPZ92330.1 YebC/PmpR family DNA-binding transcriptional regulator [Bacillota bacterium]
MAGHSKWANIKRKKAKVDAERGKLFTKISRELFVAARQGGGDPEENFRLRLVMDKARAANMPSDNIQRIIKRATGEAGADSLEEVTYEGYGPGGVAVMISAMTDNRNRSASEIRHVFSKNGGNLGETGCVAWMFKKKGLLVANLDEIGMDEEGFVDLAIESGAEDFEIDDKIVEVYTEPEDFEEVEKFFEAKGIKFSTAEITMLPQNTVKITGEDAQKVLNLIESLEDLDDVQEVYSNFDIPEDELESAVS